MATTDPLRVYHLESYLFEEVSRRFKQEKRLDAFDLFCIVIWKANRSKSLIAKALLVKAAEKGLPDLEAAARALTGDVAKATSEFEKFQVLNVGWGLRLPMASAILTVLYPQQFTVYDTRVASQLGGYKAIAGRTKPESIWKGYEEYRDAVRRKVPGLVKLRDKDRYLWGSSFKATLECDIKAGFDR